jgi:hypothetical protein
LKGNEIETNHIAREVDLTDAVGVNFFFHREYQPVFKWLNQTVDGGAAARPTTENKLRSSVSAFGAVKLHNFEFFYRVFKFARRNADATIFRRGKAPIVSKILTFVEQRRQKSVIFAQNERKALRRGRRNERQAARNRNFWNFFGKVGGEIARSPLSTAGNSSILKDAIRFLEAKPFFECFKLDSAFSRRLSRTEDKRQ